LARKSLTQLQVGLEKDLQQGHFKPPPLKNFRVNPLIAVQQNGKVRPVLNLSEPKGLSFNDNVDDGKLEKIFMSSSKQFSKTLFEAGKDATFSKFDFVDAYKNVLVKIFDLRLQGFVWKDKFFFRIFGAKTAVQNFDILANTLVSQYIYSPCAYFIVYKHLATINTYLRVGYEHPAIIYIYFCT
jgi:hypothetical protein